MRKIERTERKEREREQRRNIGIKGLRSQEKKLKKEVVVKRIDFKVEIEEVKEEVRGE